MQRAIAMIVFALSTAGITHAQAPTTHAPVPDKDRLGLTCAQILKMTSVDWIKYSGKKTSLNAADMPYGPLNANAAYGKCYDARTDALAASLARIGKSPKKAAREEFATFETDLKQFESKALADANSMNGAQLKSYADLYEKQFRYLFYEEYEAKAAKAAKPAAPAPKPAAPAAASKSSTIAAAAGDTNSAPHEATAEERAHSDADPVTQAKNRFGKILEVL